MTSHPKLIIFITVLYNTVINETEASVTKPIEGVSERILSCATEEFLEKGYSDASLRTIAAKAGTTTGSIYSRFKDKEGLFAAIVGPVAEYMMNLFVKTQEEFHAADHDPTLRNGTHRLSSENHDPWKAEANMPNKYTC